MAQFQHYQFHQQTAAQPMQYGECCAGHAIADITPPPHMPKAGYSTNGQIGTAFRTRLKARVIYLRAQDGQSMAFIQLDLLGGSLILRQRIVELVAPHTDLADGQILLGATHTHGGAGQYASCEFYNRFASSRAGFEPQFVEFLSQQISSAIIQAYQHAQPARVAVGSMAVWGLTRNRSLIPHFHNQQRLINTTAPHAAFYAIDPRLNMMRVDVLHHEKWQPLAALSTFAIHATGVSQHNDEYHADVWAHIERSLEQHVSQQHSHLPWTFAHAAIEGTHGDVAPAIRFGSAGHLETRRIGEAIGQHAITLFDQLCDQGMPLQTLRYAFSIHDIRSFSTLASPMAGAAIAAGASENLTPILHRLPPFRAGSRWRWPQHRAQAEKITLPRLLSHYLIAKPDDYPRWLPLHVVQVASWLIVGVPFEVTVAAGQRIEEAIRHATHHQGMISISSVCNDYWGYCTTQQEYQCQHYEGGHTLFGPHSQHVIAQQLCHLSQQLQQDIVVQIPEKLSFSCRVIHYLPKEKPAKGQACWLSTPQYQMSAPNQEDYWWCEWIDANSSQIEWHREYLKIQYRDQPQSPWHILTTDQGVDMGVRWIADTQHGMSRYAGFWYNPQFFGQRQYRFVIISRCGSNLYSIEFGGNTLIKNL